MQFSRHIVLVFAYGAGEGGGRRLLLPDFLVLLTM